MKREQKLLISSFFMQREWQDEDVEVGEVSLISQLPELHEAIVIVWMMSVVQSFKIIF